jgi:hypothetical protein
MSAICVETASFHLRRGGALADHITASGKKVAAQLPTAAKTCMTAVTLAQADRRIDAILGRD